MNTGAKYKTKQRDILVEYFKRYPEKHITASEVCEHCKKQGEHIGQSTIYRQLESLVDEGIINKYIIDGKTSACFEYAGEHDNNGREICFHCKCEKCGKLIHMHCDELSAIGQHLYQKHGFELNPMRTVFYGVCEDCQK
jgi:Fur family ferric uptake transcriptional regulator